MGSITIINDFEINIFCSSRLNLFDQWYSCDAKQNFLNHYSSFQCHFVTLSLLEIITIYLTQIFLIIINDENNFAAFVWKWWWTLFSGFFDKQSLLNRIYLHLSNILIKFVNAFIKYKSLSSLTFYHFHALIQLYISLFFLNHTQMFEGYHCLHKNIKQQNCFNIDNNEKCCIPKCKLKGLNASAARSESKLNTVL